MIDTFETLAVLIIAVLPGLLFELGAERQAAYLRTDIPERLLRFVATSALWHAVTLPITMLAVTEFRALEDPSVLQWGCAWVAVMLYVWVPFGLGNYPRALKLLLGPDREPTAWDQIFSDDTPKYLRLRFKADKTWVAGFYEGASSIQENQDLAVRRIRCDPKTGEIKIKNHCVDENGWTLLVKREDVDRIEVQNMPEYNRD